MKIKTVEINGNVYGELQDGKPIFVHDDGKELPFDAHATVATITRLNAEARDHRIKAETFEKQLKAYEGIEDPEFAKKSIELAKNVDEGKLIAAGKVEEIKRAAAKSAEEQVAAANKAHAEELERTKAELEKITNEFYNERIGGSFNRSKVIAEKFAIPADLVQARFGNAFKIEDGKIVAYDQAGNRIFSRARPGDLADFDEALETLVDSYPYKDSILKGSGASGMGSRASANGGTPKKFSEMNEQERTSLYKENPTKYQQLREQG